MINQRQSYGRGRSTELWYEEYKWKALVKNLVVEGKTKLNGILKDPGQSLGWIHFDLGSVYQRAAVNNEPTLWIK